MNLCNWYKIKIYVKFDHRQLLFNKIFCGFKRNRSIFSHFPSQIWGILKLINYMPTNT